MSTFAGRTVVRLLSRNQVTLPAKVVRALKLTEGDHLEVLVHESGHIALRPAVLVYAGSRAAERLRAHAAADIKAGRYGSFADTESLRTALRRRTAKSTTVGARVRGQRRESLLKPS
jgi:AbrB family looped-hinge helix DNA binding protein